MTPIQVLIVEDQGIVAQDLRQQLISLGYGVPGVVPSGEAAIEQALAVRPDLVLMDIGLEGRMDGIEAAKEIRRRLDIPIIYMTGHGDLETLRRAKYTQPFGYILKPFEIRDVQSSVEMALFRHAIDQKLKQSEARYRTVSELVSSFAYSLVPSQDGRCELEWVTEALHQVTGYSLEEVQARGYMSLIHPDDMLIFRQHQQALLSGEPHSCEFRLVARDGKVRRLRDYARPVWDDRREWPLRIVGGVQDITEQREAQAEMQRRTRELDVLQATVLDLTAQRDLPTLLRIIVERAAELLHAKGGGFYLCEPAQGQLRCVVSHNTPRDFRGTVLQYGEGAAGTVAETGRPLHVDDYRTWSKRSPAFDEEQPFRAVLSAPMLWHGEVTGVIHLLGDERRHFSQTDLQLLTTFASYAAIAVENTRLYERAHTEIAERTHAEEALRGRNELLARLNRLTQELTATLDVGQIAGRLLPTITGTVGAEGASVWLWDEEREDELICRGIAQGSEFVPVDLRLRPEEGIAGWVVQNGKCAVVPDVAEDARFCPAIDQILGFRTHSVLAVPLEARGKVIGVLEVVNKRAGGFDAEDQALVEMLAASAGIAIDNARLFETLERRNRELALLNQAGHALTSILDPGQVWVSVLDEISRLLDVTASSLWLVDPSDGTLVCQEASGPRSGVVRGWRLDAGEGIVGWVARRGRSLIVPDTRQEPRHFKGVDSQTGLDLRSIVTVPLRTKKGVIGVLQVVDESVDRFGPTDLMLLESLAATAAIAIENARLYAQSQRDMQAKSTLLHEVNHRVKNNLSAIIGVLYAEQQRDPAADETAYRSVMQDLINRVQGLATVHRLLSSTDWAPVRLSDLTARVIHSCLETTRETKPVSVEVEPSEVRVTPDQAHQIALIVNELATNTLKHGLTGDGPARIAVAIGAQGQTAHLEYRDNGPGYPAEVLRFERTSVGFDLIRSVAIEGLRGELSLRNEGGAVTSIRFKSLVNGELDTGDRTYASLTSATSAS